VLLDDTFAAVLLLDELALDALLPLDWELSDDALDALEALDAELWEL